MPPLLKDMLIPSEVSRWERLWISCSLVQEVLFKFSDTIRWSVQQHWTSASIIALRTFRSITAINIYVYNIYAYIHMYMHVLYAYTIYKTLGKIGNDICASITSLHVHTNTHILFNIDIPWFLHLQVGKLQHLFNILVHYTSVQRRVISLFVLRPIPPRFPHFLNFGFQRYWDPLRHVIRHLIGSFCLLA